MLVIVTELDCPPIPVRNFDWSAFFDGYEPGGLIGHGETEAGAIMDLLHQANDTLFERIEEKLSQQPATRHTLKISLEMVK